MMLFLPEYYGIELSQNLPIITVTRIMYVIFYIYAFLNRRRDIKIKSIIKFPEFLVLAGYFLLRIVSNLYYVFSNSQSIKTIFAIVFEQLLLIIAMWMLAPTKDEIDKLIEILIWACAIMFILGIAESFTGLKFVAPLYTVQRPMLNAFHVRLGLLRSTVTMALPNYYGNMCVLMLPLILYKYKCTCQKKYLFVIVLDIFALIHSGCRSDILFVLIVFCIYFVFLLCFGNNDWKKTFQNILLLLCVVGIVITILSLTSPLYRYYYSGTGKSLLNEFGFNYDLNEGAPEGVEGYGGNDGFETGYGGSASRTMQFSGIIYALRRNPLFGLGSGANVRGDIRYYHDGGWHPSLTYDVGYVQTFCDEGILGFCGFVMLFIYVLLTIKRVLPLSLRKYLIQSYIAYALCMLSTSNMYSFLFLFLIIHICSQEMIDQERKLHV